MVQIRSSLSILLLFAFASPSFGRRVTDNTLDLAPPAYHQLQRGSSSPQMPVSGVNAVQQVQTVPRGLVRQASTPLQANRTALLPSTTFSSDAAHLDDDCFKRDCITMWPFQPVKKATRSGQVLYDFGPNAVRENDRAILRHIRSSSYFLQLQRDPLYLKDPNPRFFVHGSEHSNIDLTWERTERRKNRKGRFIGEEYDVRAPWWTVGVDKSGEFDMIWPTYYAIHDFYMTPRTQLNLLDRASRKGREQRSNWLYMKGPNGWLDPDPRVGNTPLLARENPVLGYISVWKRYSSNVDFKEVNTQNSAQAMFTQGSNATFELPAAGQAIAWKTASVIKRLGYRNKPFPDSQWSAMEPRLVRRPDDAYIFTQQAFKQARMKLIQQYIILLPQVHDVA